MKRMDEWTGVTQEAMQQDLRAMFRGAIRASLEVFLEAGPDRFEMYSVICSVVRRDTVTNVP